MSRKSTREAIWGMTPFGLLRGLREAALLEVGEPTKGAIKRASVWYSYRMIPGALGRAVAVVRTLQGMDPQWLTAGQCDVMGTILLAVREPQAALIYLQAGRQKSPPPHQEALLTIGVAEACMMMHDGQQIVGPLVFTALAFYGDARDEKDETQAMRQFTRVFRRAAMLYWSLGRTDDAERAYRKAYELARDPRWGNRSQRYKLWWSWMRVRLGL